MATKGTAWVIRRSTDLVPSLMFMAVRELWAATELAPPPRPADDGSAGQTTGTGITGSLSAAGPAPAAAQPRCLAPVQVHGQRGEDGDHGLGLALRTPGRRADT